MTSHMNYRTIEAAMKQGRVERALAFRRVALRISGGLRHTARTLVGIFA